MNSQIIKAAKARPVHNRGVFGRLINVGAGIATVAGTKNANGLYWLHKSFTPEQNELIGKIPADVEVFLSLSADRETILAVSVPQGVKG